MNVSVCCARAENEKKSMETIRYSTYSKYKDSGVRWLGEVPEEWSVKRARFTMRINPPSQILRVLDNDSEISFVPMDAINELGGLQLDQTRIKSEVGGGYTEFQEGDVIIAKITPCFENGKGSLAMSLINSAAYGTTEIHVLRANRNLLDNRFLFYTTITHHYRKLGESEMYGAGGQKRVPPEFCQNFILSLPLLSEQICIADFLDQKTERIDTLIIKKRRLIELLKEKRSALISRCVTRGLPEAAAREFGLGPHPHFKDSGIKWLGKIPQEWSIKRLDFLASVKGRLGWKALTASEYVDEGYIFLATPNIKGEKNIDYKNVNYITKERFFESPEIILKEGDILLAKDGSTLGITNVVRELSRPATVNSSIAVIRIKQHANLKNDFLFRWLTCSFMQSKIESLKDGQGVPHLFQSDIRKFPIILPPLNEQTAISTYLDCETTKIDRLIKKIETMIDRLQEYRTALITAAVTGKIRVCPLPEEP